MTSTRTITAISAAALLALPSAALAHGKGKGKDDRPTTRPVAVSGAVTAVDAQAKTVQIAVHGRDRGARSAPRTITVSLGDAKLTVPDTDGDGTPNEIEDLRTGDRVVAFGTLARTGDATTLTAAALRSVTPKRATRTLTFQGSVSAVDASAKTLTLTVARGNRAAKPFVRQSVAFTLADAKVKVADRDGDGKRNELEDLRAGDRALVSVRVARDAAATQPFAARKVVVLGARKAPQPKRKGDDRGKRHAKGHR
jgi:hypothetical protein